MYNSNKKKVEIFLENVTTTTTSSVKEVKPENKYLAIDVVKMGLGDIYFEGSFAANWRPINITSLETGNVLESIVHPGQYLIDVSSVDSVRCRFSMVEPQSTTVKGVFLGEKPNVVMKELVPKRNALPSGDYGLISKS